MSRLHALTTSALVAAGLAASCGGGSNDGQTPQGAGGAGGDPTTTTATTTSNTDGAGGAPDTFGTNVGGLDLSTGTEGGGGSCQQLEIQFEPQTPTVMIVVDRSGSMYDSGYWDPLKTAVLSVVESLQDRVRFGFLTFTGITGQQCPLLARADGIALNNYAAIAAAYDEASVRPSGKLETPTAMTFNEVVVPELLDFPEPGPKYILFVTDGEPDRCDDVRAECARDDVIGAVQSAYAKGIGTFVFGLGQGAFEEHLQDIANAGAGQPVRRPRSGMDAQCFENRGTYADTGGSVRYYTPDPTNAAALENELNAAIAGVKSCTFDLQGSIKVDLPNASLGKVLIDGESVPYDARNGWTMESATQLVLVGDACEKLKSAKEISFDFPCEIIVPR